MKWLLILGGLLAAGLVGVVVLHESGSPRSTHTGIGDVVETISTGEQVDISAHLRPGSWTLVEFTADW